jgi:putative DNA methylase
VTEPYKKKLIEVALPLEAINRESAREKSIRHGHPSTLHLWWARRPLAACRAVLFASLVDDPSAHPEEFPTEEDQEKERKRLFAIIEELVRWENSNNERVLEQARAEIMRSTGGNPPPVLDPFCGGGSIPLEAQRLGLEAHASDLNPVAVLITKALIEIPPKFAGQPPVNPEARAQLAHGATWKGAQGLAEDVRYYGKWMRDEAYKRIGHLYPKAKLPDGREATVIAWIWARTVKCPNPACGAEMPLARSFALSTKRGKEAWLEPEVDTTARTVRFTVRKQTGAVPEGTKQRGRSRCLFCGTANISDTDLRRQAVAHGIGAQLMAIVVEDQRSRVFVSADGLDGVTAVDELETPWLAQLLPGNARWFSPPGYGLTEYEDLFTRRQRFALATFADLVLEASERVRRDAETACADVDVAQTADTTASAYANAVTTYLAESVSKLAVFHNVLARWRAGENKTAPAFGRQALPMVWDFAEANPFAGAGGDFSGVIEGSAKALVRLPSDASGECQQMDASATQYELSALVSTDPPYYDNVGYADLSDFFYVWLRRLLSRIYPDLFSTLLTPKSRELVATPYRFVGGKEEAQRFFEEGLDQAFTHMRNASNPHFPLTVYYAYKQAESDDDAAQLASTGWETMLAGLLRSGFSVSGTWPMRTEGATRLIAMDTNALASSVVLVCRPRPNESPLATRREFLNALKSELPASLKALQHGNIAPVDLAQASIGPGMAVFSRYSKVVEADGSSMTVRTALALINQALDEILAEQEGEFDADTRWAIAWFEQFGMESGEFGVAETLSKAKNTSVQGMVEAGILKSRAGKARLLRRDELSDTWDPATDSRLTVWEMTQYLIRQLDEGEAAVAALAHHLGGSAEVARDLAYRLYQICDRKGWAQEALAYNALVVAWPEIARLAASAPEAPAQGTLGV